MSPSERDELRLFLERTLRQRVDHKDRVAQALITERCAQHPDALYLLVQRAMALEALLASKANLQAEPPDPVSALSTTASASPEIGSINAWRRGLRKAAPLGAGLGLGVATGVVVGGLLLDEIGDGLFDGD